MTSSRFDQNDEAPLVTGRGTTPDGRSDFGPAEVVVNDVRYVREETLFAAMEALDRCRDVLTQISDPSYVGSYGDREVIDIYRGWARHALEAK